MEALTFYDSCLSFLCASLLCERFPSNTGVDTMHVGTCDTQVDARLMALTHQHPENLAKVLRVGGLQPAHEIAKPGCALHLTCAPRA
ncbi:dehydrogenase/oxidoreductase-like protein [Leishmania tarentolae]|uniref:Dehydrogenase/oxidoreductase-like protein n=1 Tax=Leishmania tarentolae TaxID=5689 RepID=A0A640K931_LEITA|nr:dehydrogenase/oxidoreductase-like protein [Leishmania tarentolae]